MNGRDSTNPDDAGTADVAGREALDTELGGASADQDAADSDQTMADTDQTASDADQAASDRDDADAASDEQAAEQDQAIADQQQPADADDAVIAAYEASRVARQAIKIRRIVTHDARVRSVRRRGATAAHRDAIAADRDEAARRRDVRAERVEHAVAVFDPTLARKIMQVRARAAADRERAAADRERASRDRAIAAAERARLEAELDSAHLDDLTGVFRREVGWTALRHEIDRARRADGRFVVAFVDVDGMKGVNDRDGHAAGDHVLRTLVATMRSNLRSFDPIIRYGGDEFVCGLGGADIADVERRFDRIGQSLRDAVGVGISVGVAALEAEETLDQLTVRADADLLVVKQAHRQ